jgi:hypothetical protein
MFKFLLYTFYIILFWMIFGMFFAFMGGMQWGTPAFSEAVTKTTILGFIFTVVLMFFHAMFEAML